ncbi:hypothetical protein C8F01DRAFT_1065494 [Mycena amicta]|nr:hypothetical protein C8F01DRAFT_1065494 [Mycena amicta]
MVKLWSGKFKGLDCGVENYEISADVWTEIWAETAAATKHIPSAFSRSFAGGPGKFTAKSWCFWFVYLAPGLLKGRFADRKYHDHLCQLADIIKLVLLFEITREQIDQLEEMIIDWVEKYELYYYQHDELRLSTCPLVIHGLLHIPENIRFCGPAWTTWTFFMERYCGFLKCGLTSRVYPWSNLNNRVLHYTYLEQLGVRYDLTEELAVHTASSASNVKFDEYPNTHLKNPYLATNTPAPDVRDAVATYFREALGSVATRSKVLPHLPEVMPRWGLVKVKDGDSIRCAVPALRRVEETREHCYVRYTKQVKENGKFIAYTAYGQLEQILECPLPDDDTVFKHLSSTTRLLAVILPCSGIPLGSDAAAEIVSYTQPVKTSNRLVVDLNAVEAVVGRFLTRGRWVLVDRTWGLVKPEFTPSAEDDSNPR